MKLQIGDLETLYREASRQVRVLEEKFFSVDSDIICKRNNIEEGYGEYGVGLAELIRTREELHVELNNAKIRAHNFFSEIQYSRSIKLGNPLPANFYEKTSPTSQS